MPNKIRSIDNYNVPTVAAAIYTAPNNTATVIQKLTITSEESANTQLLTIYKVAPSGVAGAANTIVYKKPIPPGPITDIPEMVNQVLEAGYSLQAIMDAGADFYLNAGLLENS
ncbi:MAG: hypothetical protein ACLGXA_20515 [Acidobacteriota bacterium]